MKVLRVISSFARDCRGVVTAEFIVVIPLLFAAFVISYEIGRALWAFNTMTSDLDAGLRYISRSSQFDTAGATKLVETGSTSGTVNRAPWNWAVPSATVSFATSTASNGSTIVTGDAKIPVTLPFLSYIPGAAITYSLHITDQTTQVGS